MTVTVGSTGIIGSGAADVSSICIDIDTLSDINVEGNETLSVTVEVTNNADLVEFPDGNTATVTIRDTSGEWWGRGCFL